MKILVALFLLAPAVAFAEGIFQYAGEHDMLTNEFDSCAYDPLYKPLIEQGHSFAHSIIYRNRMIAIDQLTYVPPFPSREVAGISLDQRISIVR